MLMVAIANEGHMPIDKVRDSIKTLVKGGALFSKVRDINYDANCADIDKVTAARGFKRGVGLWLMLVVVIAGGKLTKVAAFIIVLTVDIGSISIGVIDMV